MVQIAICLECSGSHPDHEVLQELALLVLSSSHEAGLPAPQAQPLYAGSGPWPWPVPLFRAVSPQIFKRAPQVSPPVSSPLDPWCAVVTRPHPSSVPTVLIDKTRLLAVGTVLLP